jgi:hypothetical protein
MTGSKFAREAPPWHMCRNKFDAIIDCIYEYDLGERLPDHWPMQIRGAIQSARNRLMRKHRSPRYGTALPGKYR